MSQWDDEQDPSCLFYRFPQSSQTTEAAASQQEGREQPEAPRYSMLIEWSDEDEAYLVRLPEWEAAGAVLGPVTHGATYQEAAEHGQDALETLVVSSHDLGWALPAPHRYQVPTEAEAGSAS